jgi:hypothetical protein
MRAISAAPESLLTDGCSRVGPGMGTGKSVVLESQKRAGIEGPMAVSAPSVPAFAPPALMARTIALHSAVESALLLCTMERFRSPH